jgi:hypothetical protein
VPFDIRAEICFPARLQSTGGAPHEISVRFPTDEEWAAYLRQKKFTVRTLGRGVSETLAPPPGEPDVALYQKIKLNGAPEMTPAEASKVLDVISQSQVKAVAIEGVEAEVELRVLTGTVTHRMKIPNADQVSQYKRSAVRRLDLPHNQTHAIFNSQVAAGIYDACGGHSDDYPSGIPLPHKNEVARAVIEEIELEYGPRADDDSF